MRTVGIKTLKNKLSEYIRAAAAGETILVTDRDRVVAEIVAPAKSRPATASSVFMADLIRRGVVTPAPAPFAGSPPRKPAKKIDDLLRDLEADREDR
jgi:prevent-host-death family protein